MRLSNEMSYFSIQIENVWFGYHLSRYNIDIDNMQLWRRDLDKEFGDTYSLIERKYLDLFTIMT